MLIRSQNKAILLNFSNLTATYIVKDDEDFTVLSLENENRYRLGRYSSEAKAIRQNIVLYAFYAAECFTRSVE